jgi:hypothetical protein
MAEGVLPAPVTREQEYLKAIYDQLRALTAEVAAQRPQPLETIPGTVELREPVKPPTPAPKPRRKKGRRVR